MKKIFTFPYLLALRFLHWKMRKTLNSRQIWPRNSFILGSFTPLVSDLDLTVLLESETSAVLFDQKKKEVQRSLQLGKKLFPWLGEANVYEEKILPLIQLFANPFELDRDPGLREKFSKYPPPKYTREEGAVFLLRMLEADYQNLLHRPDKRLRKWRQHYRSIETRLPEVQMALQVPFDKRKPVNSLISAALHLAQEWNEIIGAQARSWTEIYLELRSKNLGLQHMAEITRSQKWWWILFPQKLCRFHSYAPGLPKESAGLFVAQIRWEIHGLFSQKLSCGNDLEIENHFNDIEALVKRISDLGLSVELRSLVTDLQLAKPYFATSFASLLEHPPLSKPEVNPKWVE